MANGADFVLEIEGEPGRYQVQVSSPAGGDSAVVNLDSSAIADRLGGVEAAVLGSAVQTRSAMLTLERPAREIGRAMFDAVFRDAIFGLYLSSRQQAEARDETLRLVLQIRAPELAMLPWELLHNEDLGGYLCLRQPVVRHVEMMEPVTALLVTPPLRILGMIALPGTRAILDAETECQNLQRALQRLMDAGLVQLEWVREQTREALQTALYRGCHVLHFIGHGGYDASRRQGMIAFADQRGGEHMLHAEALARLISVARPRPRLVVLNSCQTGAGSAQDLFSSAAAVLEETVPAVVAMQFAITDHAAAVFAGAFYEALASNQPVDEAVRAGRVALLVDKDDSLEWMTPVLYMRSGDARLFDLATTSPVVTSQALCRQGAEAENAGDYAGAAARYRAALDTDPGSAQAKARLQACESQIQIAELQARMREQFAAGWYQAVLETAERLRALDPSAGDPDGLATLAWQRTQPPVEALAAEPPAPAPTAPARTGTRARTRSVLLAACGIALLATMAVLVVWGPGRPGGGKPTPTPSIAVTPSTIAVPDVFGLSADPAIARLRQAGFSVRSIQVCSNSVAPGLVRQVLTDIGAQDGVIVVDRGGTTQAGAQQPAGAKLVVKVSTGPC